MSAAMQCEEKKDQDTSKRAPKRMFDALEIQQQLQKEKKWLLFRGPLGQGFYDYTLAYRHVTIYEIIITTHCLWVGLD